MRKPLSRSLVSGTWRLVATCSARMFCDRLVQLSLFHLSSLIPAPLPASIPASSLLPLSVLWMKLPIHQGYSVEQRGNTHTYTHTSTHAHTHTHTYSHIHTHTYTHTHIHIDTQTHTHRDRHTHTHRGREREREREGRKRKVEGLRESKIAGF